MEVVHVEKKGKMLDTLEGFHIYKETKPGNQIKDKLTVRENAISESIVQEGPYSSTAKKELKITQSREASHPHKRSMLHRDRSPPTTSRRSRQPPHRKTVSNTNLYAYARRATQTVTTEHKRSDSTIAELDKLQPTQNRKQ